MTQQHTSEDESSKIQIPCNFQSTVVATAVFCLECDASVQDGGSMPEWSHMPKASLNVLCFESVQLRTVLTVLHTKSNLFMKKTRD